RALMSTRRGMNRVELLVVLAIILTLAALLLPGVQHVRSASARAESQNNLKQIGVGVYQIAAIYNCFEPPGVGRVPASGPNLRLFFHLIPHIEADTLYARYAKDPSGVPPHNGTIKFYCPPADPTNPGTGTLLTSYAANAAIFGLTDGGSVRFPQM